MKNYYFPEKQPTVQLNELAWLFLIIPIIIISAPYLYIAATANLAMVDLVREISSPETNMFTIKIEADRTTSIYDALEKAHNFRPNNKLVSYHKAQLSFWSGNLDETIKILEESQGGSISPFSEILLGYALWQSGNSSRALRVLGQLSNSEQFFRHWAFVSETEKIYETMEISYKQLMAMDPDDASVQAGYWFARSNLLIRNAESIDIDDSIKKAFEYNYENYPRLLDLGKALVDSGLYPLATPILEQAVILDGGNSHWASYYLGLAYYYQKQYQLAATALSSVIQRTPDFGRGYHWLARTMVNMGRFDEAKINYEEAINALPDDERLLKEYQSFQSDIQESKN